MNDYRRDLEVPRYGDQPLRHRGHVVRMALFYSFWTLLSTALVVLALYEIATGDAGFIFMLCIFGLIGFLFGYWAYHYVRDLNADPVLYEGEVVKKWHKANVLFFFLPSFYIYVAEPNALRLEEEGNKPWNKVFTIGRQEYAMLLETDLVRIQCYPHSLAVESIERFDETDKKFVPAASGAAV
jgi:hypothetical protein